MLLPIPRKRFTLKIYIPCAAHAGISQVCLYVLLGEMYSFSTPDFMVVGLVLLGSRRPRLQSVIY
jgi:hypothetical protein